MSVASIESEVEGLLAFVDLAIRDARAKLDGGSGAERVSAAGDLVFLQRRREILQSRRDDLKDAPGGLLSSTIEWWKEQGMLIMLGL